MFYEGTRFHQERYNEYGARLGDLADLVRKGLRISVERYDETMRYVDACKAQISELLKGHTCDPDSGCRGTCTVRPGINRRSKDERTMDCFGNAGNFRSDAGSEWVAAGAAT